MLKKIKTIASAIKEGIRDEKRNRHNYEMMMDAIKKAIETNHPRAQKFGIEIENGETIDMVWLWYGVGEGATPMKRIQELLEENKRLNYLLEKAKSHD